MISYMRGDSAFPAEVRLYDWSIVTLHSQRKFDFGRWVVHRDDAFPAEGRFGWSINGRSLDNAYVNQTSFVSLGLLYRKWWLLNKLGEQMHAWFHTCVVTVPSQRKFDYTTGQSFTVTLHSQRTFDFGRWVVHRDDGFPAEGRFGWSINGRSLDNAYTNQTSFVSLGLLYRKWWLYLTNWESKCMMISYMRGDSAFPAEVRLYDWTIRLVNRSPWRCIPSGNSTAAGGSFTAWRCIPSGGSITAI